jgi:transcriptional regulator with XRE-family HTH domain
LASRAHLKKKMNFKMNIEEINMLTELDNNEAVGEKGSREPNLNRVILRKALMRSQNVFLQRLAQAMVAKQIRSVASLARIAGMSAQTCRQYVNGVRFPSDEVVEKLATVLAVSADWLKGETPEPTTTSNRLLLELEDESGQTVTILAQRTADGFTTLTKGLRLLSIAEV